MHTQIMHENAITIHPITSIAKLKRNKSLWQKLLFVLSEYCTWLWYGKTQAVPLNIL
jgi:hypothetical protein